MQEELGRAGVEFERIAGVDGDALAVEALDAFRRARAVLSPQGWLPGEVGCFLSHFEAWRRIAAHEDAWGAVFEDDIRVSSDLATLLASADWIPAEADVVRLEANRSMRLGGRRPIAAAPARSLYKASSGTSGSAGYVLSGRAARWLMTTPPELHACVDVFLFKPKASRVARKLRRYQVVPAVCVQEGVLPDTEARLKSLIKSRITRGRGYSDRSHPLLRLWPIQRFAVPFRP